MTPAHTVRIIGGRCKRSRLPVLDSPGLRPTPDRVRVTLFNWLGIDLSGCRCLDAFAGAGSLGFEAASRGAAEVVMLETQSQVFQSLKHTRQKLALSEVQVFQEDALTYMSRVACHSFEVVFLDPPFAATDLRQRAVQAATRVLVPGGLIYLESPEVSTSLNLPQELLLHRQARAGSVHFELRRRAD